MSELKLSSASASVYAYRFNLYIEVSTQHISVHVPYLCDVLNVPLYCQDCVLPFYFTSFLIIFFRSVAANVLSATRI